MYERQATMADAENLERGYRAVWQDRQKLCVAKLAPGLHPGMTAGHFSTLVLEQGMSTREDRCLGLYVWGSLTIRSVERVRIRRQRTRPLKAAIRDIERLLLQYNVKVEAD